MLAAGRWLVTLDHIRPSQFWNDSLRTALLGYPAALAAGSLPKQTWPGAMRLHREAARSCAADEDRVGG